MSVVESNLVENEGAAAGPLLASGFWLIVSEQFDPHTAKRRFGQLAGAGTVGGLVGALIAERAAAWFGGPAMLPVLGLLQVVCAVLVRRLVTGPAAHPELTVGAGLEAAAARSGIRVIAETPYLRQLAILVLLGTTGAALVDYLFKASAVDTFGRGDQLLRFFALYYAGTSIVTLVLQASSAHVVLERYGLGATASTPSVALLLGSLVGLVAPGFGSLVAARGGESILRSSWFRAGYELFYTPIPAEEKRATKSLIDVVFDRLGDASGGALVRASILLVPALHRPTILMLAVACSVGGIIAACRLNRGYVGSDETRDPLTINRWRSYRLAYTFASGTVPMVQQITFLNLSADEQLVLVATASERNFAEAAARSFQIIRTWQPMLPGDEKPVRQN